MSQYHLLCTGGRFLVAYQIIAVLAVYLLITAVMNQSSAFMLSHQTRLLLSLGAVPFLFPCLCLLPLLHRSNSAASAACTQKVADSVFILAAACGQVSRLNCTVAAPVLDLLADSFVKCQNQLGGCSCSSAVQQISCNRSI